MRCDMALRVSGIVDDREEFEVVFQHEDVLSLDDVDEGELGTIQFDDVDGRSRWS